MISEERLERFEETLGNIREDVATIKAKLNNGITDDVKELKKRTTKLEKWRWMAGGGLVVIVFLVKLIWK